MGWLWCLIGSGALGAGAFFLRDLPAAALICALVFFSAGAGELAVGCLMAAAVGVCVGADGKKADGRGDLVALVLAVLGVGCLGADGNLTRAQSWVLFTVGVISWLCLSGGARRLGASGRGLWRAVLGALLLSAGAWLGCAGVPRVTAFGITAGMLAAVWLVPVLMLGIWCARRKTHAAGERRVQGAAWLLAGGVGLLGILGGGVALPQSALVVFLPAVVLAGAGTLIKKPRWLGGAVYCLAAVILWL